MNGRECWEYLEVFDGNTLYYYTCTSKPHFSDDKNVYYIIWFVYRYVLGCETLEEALKYADLQTIKKFKLSRAFSKDAGGNTEAELFLGNDKFGKISLCVGRKHLEDSEKTVNYIKTVLEILYNRYNILEQLECYVKNCSTSKFASRQPKGVIEAKAVIKSGLIYMEKDKRYKELIAQYKKTRREILGEYYYE